MWIFFALLSAFSDSLRNLINKQLSSQVVPNVINLSIFLFSLPLYIVLLCMKGLPLIGQNLWFFMAAHILLDLVSTILLTRALAHGDISHVTPLLAFSSLFVAITAPFILHEYPSFMGFVGIVSIVIGAYLLNTVSERKSLIQPILDLFSNKASRLGIIVAFLWAIDGQVLKIASVKSSPFFVLSLSAFVISVVFFVMIYLNKKSILIINQFKRHSLLLILIGIVAAGSLSGMLLAYTMPGGLVAYVISVKRLSLVFGALSGWIFFKEKHIGKRLTGAIIMFVGVIIITLSSI